MDWITQFLEYTDGVSTPDIFREWAAIGAVAGALERRVWVHTARKNLYPNTYILLVAPPGVGKTEIISIVQDLWNSVQKFHVAPDNMTKASLIDELADADTKSIIQDGLIEYHSLLVAADEFGVFCPAHDMEFLSVLNKIFDCPPTYRETRRSREEPTHIIHPQMNILAGVQPGFLATSMPEEAWSMGFTSRLIMIYSSTPKRQDIFHQNETRSGLKKHLKTGLESMSNLYGQVEFTDDAKKEIRHWLMVENLSPIPQHSKLQHYVPRRILSLLKLSMVAAVSNGLRMTITLEDVNRAREWILSAEQRMPDIFREMAGRSDGQVIQELHLYLWQKWVRTKAPIHESMAITFLQARVPSEKVLRILDLCERSGAIQKMSMPGGNGYVPKPLIDNPAVE